MMRRLSTGLGLQTYQEKLFIGETPPGGEGIKRYMPLGFIEDNGAKQKILDARSTHTYTDNPKFPTAWAKANKIAGTVRMIFAPIDPETMETAADPRIVVGDLNEDTGKFTIRGDLTRRFVTEAEALYGMTFHMRTDGNLDPENWAGRSRERR